MLFGAHESVAGGLERSLERALDDGCHALQVFTKNPNAWREREIGPEAVEAFRTGRGRWAGSLDGRPARVLSHAAYLINLCADDRSILERSRESLLAELLRSDALGVDLVVFHPGSHLGLGEERGIDRIGESLGWILERAVERAPRLATRLCIENMAGQGSTLGHELDQIGAMIAATGRRGRTLGVCIDTCHAFAAGHDLADEAGYEEFWEDFECYVGLDRLACFHVNDSRYALGERLDRHAWIGEGEAGLRLFWRLANDPRFADHPGVLELPPDDGCYCKNLAKLRGLEGAPEPRDRAKAVAKRSGGHRRALAR